MNDKREHKEETEMLTQRYLEGSTTLQEERRLAELLGEKQDATAEEKAILAMLGRGGHSAEEMERWLEEDETELYDTIVAQRRRRIIIRRWAVAASVAVVVGFSLWHVLPQKGGDMMPTAMQERPTYNATAAVETLQTPDTPCDSTSRVRQLKLRKHIANAAVAEEKERETGMNDGFKEALAYIDARLNTVMDSVSQAQAEQVIATDAHLSRLAYNDDTAFME
ncbi:MAG: hypothetical protein Q4D28_02630 [Prevotellaceae bacterium]|nr:hypothetical protein [Prevotellaceae bacterium]